LAKKIYETMDSVLYEAINLLSHCPCLEGCPSCIGTESISNSIKNDTLLLLKSLKDESI
jgi:DEAD/DEAH box helicase domain-containing protein